MSRTAMPYRPLGRCGTKVSALGFGGWTTFGGSVKDEAAITTLFKTAYEAGVNFFDMADSYSLGEAERLMGRALKPFPRHTLVLSSKLYWPMSDDVNDRGLSRKHIMESVDKSLARIGTDYLDIYFCHRFDKETPLEETCRAMDDLVRRGKILYWGTSEWTAGQLQETHRLCADMNLYHPRVEQPQYSLLVRHAFENEIQPEAQRQGMGLVTWSPLASGLLSGKYDNGIPSGSRLDQIEWIKKIVATPENLEKVRAFKDLAETLRCTRSQLALAWTLAQDGVSSVIMGATCIDQLKENLGSLEVLIPADLLQKVEKLFPPVARG